MGDPKVLRRLLGVGAAGGLLLALLHCDEMTNPDDGVVLPFLIVQPAAGAQGAALPAIGAVPVNIQAGIARSQSASPRLRISATGASFTGGGPTPSAPRAADCVDLPDDPSAPPFSLVPIVVALQSTTAAVGSASVFVELVVPQESAADASTIDAADAGDAAIDAASADAASSDAAPDAATTVDAGAPDASDDNGDENATTPEERVALCASYHVVKSSLLQLAPAVATADSGAAQDGGTDAGTTTGDAGDAAAAGDASDAEAVDAAEGG